ncbi:hypothetical protein AaE_013709, partial [Aphanomyces astaci]
MLSKRELQACSMLNHPNIVAFRYSFRGDGFLHLVFDYAPSTLSKIIAKAKHGLRLAHVRAIAYQLCKAIYCCHQNRIIHRDIKPDNILLDDKGMVKLCDFGTSIVCFVPLVLLRPFFRQASREPSNSTAKRCRITWPRGGTGPRNKSCGSYKRQTLENTLDLCKFTPELTNYSYSADMWSVGCVVCEMLLGRPLFCGENQMDQIKLIQEMLGPLPPSLSSRLPKGVSLNAKATTYPTHSLQDAIGATCPPDAVDFITRTVVLDARKRMT